MNVGMNILVAESNSTLRSAIAEALMKMLSEHDPFVREEGLYEDFLEIIAAPFDMVVCSETLNRSGPDDPQNGLRSMLEWQTNLVKTKDQPIFIILADNPSNVRRSQLLWVQRNTEEPGKSKTLEDLRALISQVHMVT